MRNISIAAVLLLAASCQQSAPPVQKSTTAAATAPRTAEKTERGPIPWIADDYPRALAQARAEKKPLFIDAWATWCHSCLSMKSFVFTDPSLAPLASRYVWLAIDTEKPENAAVLRKYPVSAYPTFFVVDATDESVAGRWLGSMATGELRTFLDDGERSVQLAHAGGMPPGDPLTILRNGDRAELSGDHAAAAKLYAQAISAAPATWTRRMEALAAEARSLLAAKDFDGCVQLVLAHMNDGGNSTSAADLASTAADCADGLPTADPRAETLRRAAAERLLALANDANVPFSADDRSDSYRTVWEILDKLNDPAGARSAAEKRLAVLEAAAGKAPDATAASTFDWARAETNLYLKHPDDAKKLLETSERNLPDDYNPPARLARVHMELAEYGEALAAIDRALTKAYGPRKGNLLKLKADVLEKQGRYDEARATVSEELALYKSLPEGQKRPTAEQAAERRLSTLAKK